MESPAFPSADEQDRILNEARTAIKRSAFQMRKAIEEDNMREALKHASQMLAEMRTSQLSPQKYYELYMQAFDQLGLLESFFGDERSKGRSYSELYELVQHAGNVLPRLYLMVAVGCLYIKSGEAAPRDLLKDLVEMCKGVQHPTRGLFLRAYLCQRARALLPDTGSAFEGPGGNIHDALDFLLSNFIEMNKLWVRLQHQGSARDKDKRERERQQLQDLVGKNLTYLSQLDGLHFDMYKDQVLPRVLEQIVSCKDDIGQQYLMQALIQGFPDAFHLGTLDALLGALPELQSGVKVHSVMASLMDRLAKYAVSEPAVLTQLLDMGAFEQFKDAVARVLAAHTDMAAADAVEMYVALMNFTGSVHPDLVDNVNKVLAAAHSALSSRSLSGDSRAEKQLVVLLSVPLTKYGVNTTLGLSQYPSLMSLLRHTTHKELAVRICQSVVDQATRIADVDKVASMFRFISPLVADPEEGGMDIDDEDIEEEQVLVARLLHFLASPDIDTHYTILTTAHEHLLRGGPKRLRTTLPSLVFCGLQLERRLAAGATAAPASATAAATAEAAPAKAAAAKEPEAEAAKKVEAAGDPESGEKEAAEEPPAEVKEAAPAAATEAPPASSKPKVTCEALLQWLLGCIGPLTGGDAAEPTIALRLLLACALAASEEGGLEMLAYQFFEEAMTLYEESLPDQRQRVTALADVIGTLNRCYIFTPDNREALCQAATGASAKLLKRAEQCRALCACTHLSWQEERKALATPASQPAVRDATKVLHCLKRALKVAGLAKQQFAATARTRDAAHVGLYIDIFNRYLYYYDLGVEEFSASVVQQIIELVQGELSSGGAAVDQETQRHWQATVGHVVAAQQGSKGPEAKARYAALKIE